MLVELCRKIERTKEFQNFIIGTIFFSVFLVCLEGYPELLHRYGEIFYWLDHIIFVIFFIEIIIRIGSYGRKFGQFFLDKWNVFDFLLVAVYLLPSTHFAIFLRFVRILRLFRLLAIVQQREIEHLQNIKLSEKNAELLNAYRELAAEKAKSERLLLNILPHLVAQRLKEGSHIIADSYPDATVLFADLVGFTKLSASISPEGLVGMLDNIFCRFDRLVEKYDVEKIKTIGDAYMVVGGIPQALPKHAENIAEMALDMLHEIELFNRESGHHLQLRIGFHSGAVVAGVIGQKKFIYDLWGDTVNTASRMESHSMPNKIQVSEEIYQKLHKKFIFEKRELLTVKGKGEMQTYFLLGRQHESH
ncbi:family 3 adenylate cyclase [Beggiatoa alba B18LD]|uniref:Adenylate cyclase n=1 Tax=Beggiatoa alba B18LD TaxID=395493 RepID=I3CI19_9GAMM|nr:adenylate/guanylate cyclase domain-containing protein [Beggiatoa alba]EIJ43262.1 family 3 adenylate cyclase [Beggiatoa alba B18LD]